MLCGIARPFHLKFELSANQLTSVITGPLDLATTDRFMVGHLMQLGQAGQTLRALIIDLSDCSAIDVEGASALAGIGHHCPTFGVVRRTLVLPRCARPRHNLQRLTDVHRLERYYQFRQPLPFSIN